MHSPEDAGVEVSSMASPGRWALRPLMQTFAPPVVRQRFLDDGAPPLGDSSARATAVPTSHDAARRAVIGRPAMPPAPPLTCSPRERLRQFEVKARASHVRAA